MTPTPQWYDSPETEQMTIPVMKKGMTAFLITGDAARNKVQTMPGGAYATIKIELPENWDSLMTELGYEPLESYRIVEQMIHSEKCVKSGKTHWKNYGKPQETHWKNYDNYLKSRWKKCIFVPG